MSPASLRRYRAERLLREEFRALRAAVLETVRGRLRAAGVELDPSDLDACYAQAWQGLYAATLEGQRILSPAGWLVVATFRRAIDEQRARARLGLDHHRRETRADGDGADGACDPDIAAQLDQRRTLRHLLEGLRLDLSERERHAATLCYLQGLSRAQAARSMGLSEARMRKLMEGRGHARPGVAAKVAALADTITAGAWCEERASLMRGLAYGILDPQGERHRLALAHTAACPACRAYVASLRGLAAILPPVPSLLSLLLAGGRGAAWALGRGAVGAGGQAAGAGARAGGAAGGAPASASAAVSSGTAASGAAGAAGGGWLLAGGSVGAKLAAGCLIALGVGAGCAVLGAGHGAATTPRREPARAHVESAAARARTASVAGTGVQLAVGPSPPPPPRAPAGRMRAPASLPSGTTPASREFGLEHAGALPGAEASGAAARPARRVAARVAGAGGEFTPAAVQSSTQASPARLATRTSGATSPAQREFSPG